MWSHSRGKGEFRNNFWSVIMVEPWKSLPDVVKGVDNMQGRKRNSGVGQQ